MSPSPLYRRAGWRILPILFCCYLVNYVDRVNVSFAKEHLATALHLDDAAYGLGAGLFFVGYFCFQVPGNLVLERLGARRTIAAIILLWGAISVLGAFVRTEQEFYAQRLLLGAAEAGFFPGVILHLTRWFPTALRARIFALFLTAIPVAGLIGGPLSGFILEHPPGGPLHPWQWLFILEALPCALLSLWVFRGLPDRPADAKWLTAEESAWMSADLAADQARTTPDATTGSTWKALASPTVVKLCLLYFCTMVGLYGLSFWLPTFVQAQGWHGPLQVGLASAVPWGCAVGAMLFTGARSDRLQERRIHAGSAAMVGALGFLLCALTLGTPDGAYTIVMAASGVMGLMAVLWSLPGSLLGGTSAAAGIALVNSFGNLGGFVSPFVIGQLTRTTQSPTAGLYLLAGVLALAMLLLFVDRSLEPTRRP